MKCHHQHLKLETYIPDFVDWRRDKWESPWIEETFKYCDPVSVNRFILCRQSVCENENFITAPKARYTKQTCNILVLSYSSVWNLMTIDEFLKKMLKNEVPRKNVKNCFNILKLCLGLYLLIWKQLFYWNQKWILMTDKYSVNSKAISGSKTKCNVTL